MNSAFLPFAIVAFGAAAFCFLVFLISFLRDRRKLRHGFYLFFVLFFLAIGLLALLAVVSDTAANLVFLGLLALTVLTVLALAVFLICNGVTMLRREGRRPANLLSLLAGIGILAFVPFNQVVDHIDWAPVEILRGSVNLFLTYVSFLFVCFLLYAIVYGWVGTKDRLDFIVVLGSGLLNGNRVPPLLASRLDRAQRLLDRESANGRDLTVITSGGQGPDEDVPEARAMADYLHARGVPSERMIEEDQSRNTVQNLTFSAEIMRRRLPDYRCAVVTNNFHVLRAALIARKAKVNGQVIGSRTAMYYWPSATIREFVAVFLDHRIVNFTVFGLLVATQVANVTTA